MTKQALEAEVMKLLKACDDLAVENNLLKKKFRIMNYMAGLPADARSKSVEESFCNCKREADEADLFEQVKGIYQELRSGIKNCGEEFSAFSDSQAIQEGDKQTILTVIKGNKED